MTEHRLSTGVPGLDSHLGGGLIPGTMTVLVGSSGIGKTQFGLQFLNAGLHQEGRRGIIYDMIARGDSQNHTVYANSLFGWTLQEEPGERRFDPESFFEEDYLLGDYFHALTKQGKRVTRRDLDFDDWMDWKSDLTRHLDATIAFFFQHFFRGTRRFLVDGIEPVNHQGESIQFELLEYIYHQIIQKDSDWVARDLFRQHYRTWEAEIQKRLYPNNEVGCVVAYTSPESSLDAMLDKPFDEGDLLSQANTVIYLGKIRDGVRFRRAMYISKHRGSVCPDEILFYDIDDHGLKLQS
ncbi:MAG: recombinase RecA [Thermoguttaceae bacterium]|nr:recombinase RecA [Thermoguttaceae bacterium]